MADKKDFKDFKAQNFKKHEPTVNTVERESSTEKASASDVFSGVLEKKEKKSRRMQLLLTEANFKILEDVSIDTGRSKNDVINLLISTFGESMGL